MPELLKNKYFKDAFIKKLSESIQKVYPPFDTGSFQSFLYDGWENKELKEKMRHITLCLNKLLPDDYPESIHILKQVAPQFGDFEGMVFPDYVEVYGLDYLELSLSSLKYFTRFGSSEFAIRPFLNKYFKESIDLLYECTQDENVHVRRFASEGSRLRLPWGMSVPQLKTNPEVILPILEALKDDPEMYVLKSVANSLNDLSKDYDDLMLQTCERWFGKNKNTDWLIKHACRGLLKKGNPRALNLFGFKASQHCVLKNFCCSHNTLSMGEDLIFSFELHNMDNEPCKVRVEYAIDSQKFNNKVSKKVFQITEKIFDPGIHLIQKKHSFQDRSTRKHYPGIHTLSLILNGSVQHSYPLQLKSN